MRDVPAPLPPSVLEAIYGHKEGKVNRIDGWRPGALEEWRTASILTGALWVVGALPRPDPETVQKVRLALRYTRQAGERPDEPLAELDGG